MAEPGETRRVEAAAVLADGVRLEDPVEVAAPLVPRALSRVVLFGAAGSGSGSDSYSGSGSGSDSDSGSGSGSGSGALETGLATLGAFGATKAAAGLEGEVLDCFPTANSSSSLSSSNRETAFFFTGAAVKGVGAGFWAGADRFASKLVLRAAAAAETRLATAAAGF